MAILDRFQILLRHIVAAGDKLVSIGSIIVDGADLDVEGAKDVQARRHLQGFLHALGAVFKHRKPWETIAEDHGSLCGRAAEFFDHHLAEDAPAFHRFFADIRRLYRGAEQVELNDRDAAGDDFVEALGHRFAGRRGRNAQDPGIGKVLNEFQLAFRRPAGLRRDIQRHAKIGRGRLGAIDDLLDEWVALRVGDKADRDLVVRQNG